MTLHPVARDSVKNLKKRYHWDKKWVKTIDMDYLENRVFVDEAGFNINMRSLNARFIRNTQSIIKTPTTRVIIHTILGAMTTYNVISIEIREPFKPKKIKDDGSRSLWQKICQKELSQSII